MTRKVQKVAQLLDSYTVMMMMMMIFLSCGMFSAILILTKLYYFHCTYLTFRGEKSFSVVRKC